MIYRTPEEQAKIIQENSIYGVTGQRSIDMTTEGMKEVLEHLKDEPILPAFFLNSQNIFHKLFDISMDDILYVTPKNIAEAPLYLLISFDDEVAQITSFNAPIRWERMPDDIPEVLSYEERTAILAGLILDNGLDTNGDMIALEKVLRYIHERMPKSKED